MCPNSLLFVLQPSSYEAVEPLDLEEFLMSQLKSGDATLMQELGEFPDDDLKVEQVEKERRTFRHSVPEEGWVIVHKYSDKNASQNDSFIDYVK